MSDLNEQRRLAGISELSEMGEKLNWYKIAKRTCNLVDMLRTLCDHAKKSDKGDAKAPKQYADLLGFVARDFKELIRLRPALARLRMGEEVQTERRKQEYDLGYLPYALLVTDPDLLTRELRAEGYSKGFKVTKVETVGGKAGNTARAVYVVQLDDGSVREYRASVSYEG